MKSEFRQSTVYTYPYYTMAPNGRYYVVFSPGKAWDHEFNTLLTEFDESACAKQTGVLTLKFP